ncbi:MAG: glycosyltransferase [Verrucomicrobiales bacterium]|nr:glycosyltransferase [Verrucomicrobiales bacterium]
MAFQKGTLMHWEMLIGWVLAGGLAVSLLALAWGHVDALRYYGRRNPPRARSPWPSVSILKPIEGVDEGTADALATFCRLEYLGDLEVLVGVLRDDDPIVQVVTELQRRFPHCRLRLVRADLLGTNRKSSIMEALWREARGEYLLFSDADVSVQSDYVPRVLDELLAPGVGCVTCLPRSVGARTLGGGIIALHYGCVYLPQWMLARQTTGISWAIGHTMAVSRSVLDRLGGFRQFINHLADDYELGRRTAQMGLRVVVAPMLVDCTMPHESLGRAVNRLQRWKRTIRRARGPASIGVVLTLPTIWALLGVVWAPASVQSWSILAAVLGLRWIGAWVLQTRVGMPDWPRIWWLLPLVDLLELWTLIGAYTGDRVTWRGHDYRLLPDGTLAR